MDDNGSNFGNKEIMAENLTRYISMLEKNGKSRYEIASELSVPVSSLNSWARGVYYPRIDKIEKMARYFNCNKVDLIEKKGTVFLTDKETAVASQIFNSVSGRLLLAVICKMSDKQKAMLLKMANMLIEEVE